ncbi:MAG: hypothetical protein M1820_007215 [Bogoriella megaspora]|nr:MAG: hypothetical protein M1820_007215 [Bogoriella megaspora]
MQWHGTITLALQLLIYVILLNGPNNASAASVEKRHADFWQVRTHLKKDHSTAEEDLEVHPSKYFHESRFHPHYDGRFTDKPLLYEHRGPHLTALIQTYLSTMSSLGAETWLMHGSLLGWWWNKKLMPWDTDFDLMISERTMHHLAGYYNMSMHSFTLYTIPQPTSKPYSESGAQETGPAGESKKDGGEGVVREYMLEVNPHYLNDTEDLYNHIDARWVDTTTGLFIDITTLRHNTTFTRLGGRPDRMMCKDGHKYWYDEIYPLRESVFEGVPVKIPYAYSSLLVEEYGPGALTDTSFENHWFDEEVGNWEMVKAGRRPKVQNELRDVRLGWGAQWWLMFGW